MKETTRWTLQQLLLPWAAAWRRQFGCCCRTREGEAREKAARDAGRRRRPLAPLSLPTAAHQARHQLRAMSSAGLMSSLRSAVACTKFSLLKNKPSFM